MSEQVRKWDNEVKNMWGCSQELNFDAFSHQSDWFSGSYGVYLANHALWTTAGRYFRQLKIAEDKWNDDPWREWISQYSLTINTNKNTWLAEGLDYFPIDLTQINLNLSTPDEPTKKYERYKIASLIGVGHRQTLPETVLVSGLWKDQNGYNIEISSCLVEALAADDIAYALLLTDAFFQWLPTEWEGRDYVKLQEVMSLWLVKNENHNEGIDITDPYAVKHAMYRIYPNNFTRKTLSLVSSDKFNRFWRTQNGCIFLKSEAWGVHTESGHHTTEIVGDRLIATSTVLTEFLNKTSRNLIILVKAENYIKSSQYDGHFAIKSAVVVISAKGLVRIVTRIPKKKQDAVMKLDQHAKKSFESCYRAISKIK